MMTTSATTG
jgi:hypothetical protein